MTDKKISDLTALAASDSADLLPVLDISAVETKKITTSNLLSSLISLMGAGSLAWSLIDKTVSSINDITTKTATFLTLTGPDKILGRTSSGSGVLETIDCTAFARTLLDDADAATVLSTLGLTVSDADLVEAKTGWFEISDFDGTFPLLEYYTGSSCISATEWAASTGYAVGDFVYATIRSDDAYLYECMATGTSGLTEPTWGDAAVDEDVTDNDITWRARSLHVIEMTTDLRAALSPGTAVKLTFSTGPIYGVIVYLTASRMVLKTNKHLPYLPFTLETGRPEKTRQLDFYGPNGAYSPTDHMILDTLRHPYTWFGPSSIIVNVNVIHTVDDAETVVNIQKTSNGWDIMKNGIVPGEEYAYSYESFDAYSNSATVDYGAGLDIKVTGTSDAENLKVSITLVTI